MPEDTLRDTQKLLRELGETPQRTGGEATVAPQRFCGACWAALPADTVDCPSCGRSLAELEAARQAKAAADQSWVPPNRADAPAAPAPASTAVADYGLTPPAAAAVPEPLAQELRKSRHHFLMAVAIGSAWGGAVMVAAWFTIQNISPKSSGTPAPVTPPSNAAVIARSNGPANSPGNTPVANPSVTVLTKAGSHVEWENPYPELRLELFMGDTRVARQPDDERVPAGAYQVRIYPRSGNWHVDGKSVVAEEGAQLQVSVTPQDAARFFVKLGDRFADARKPADAISAWERALEVDRDHLHAHLRLGTALALEHRYQDAREHLDAALKLDSANTAAREGKTLVDQLENAEKVR